MSLRRRVVLGMVVVAIVLGVAGAYAAWLVGVVVFGAVRGPGGNDNEEQGEP